MHELLRCYETEEFWRSKNVEYSVFHFVCKEIILSPCELLMHELFDIHQDIVKQVLSFLLSVKADIFYINIFIFCKNLIRISAVVRIFFASLTATIIKEIKLKKVFC